MIDTHCHLNDSQFDDIDNVINDFFSMGGDAIICVGADIASSLRACEISQQYDNIYYTVGVHPEDCENYDESELEDLLKSKTDRLVAIGEIGLDYHFTKENKDIQKQVFISQIKLANKYRLPIVIHCRDAFGDTLDILYQYMPLYGAVFHCYSGSLEFAESLIKMGIKISFTGSVTFKNANNLKEVAKTIPLDAFFFETDAPYLAPEPHRGRRNEPKYVFDTAKYVANLREMDENELIMLTDRNARAFFHLNA